MKLSKFHGNLGILALVLLMMGTILPATIAKTDQLGSSNIDKSESFLLARLRRFKFNRLKVKAPPGRFTTSAAVRGCSSDDKNKAVENIMALIPSNVSNSGVKSSDNLSKPNVELTTSPHPTVLFYLPQNSTETATFGLRTFDENGNEIPKRIYYANIKLPPTKYKGGIVILDLANIANKTNLPELKIGESHTYKWNITFCEQTRNGEISGLIRRVDPNIPLVRQLDANAMVQDIDPNTILANELTKVNKTQQPSVYLTNGIWYSAVSSLAELLKNNPQNSNLQQDWKDLLSDNLKNIPEKTIIGNAIITDVEIVNQN